MSSDTLLSINTQQMPAPDNPSEAWLWEGPEVHQPEAEIGALAIKTPGSPAVTEVTPDFVDAARAEARKALMSVDPHRYDDMGRSTVRAAESTGSSQLGATGEPLSDANRQARAKLEFAEAMRLEEQPVQPAGKPDVLAELGYQTPQHEELIIPERLAVKAAQGALRTLRGLRPRVHIGVAGGHGLAH